MIKKLFLMQINNQIMKAAIALFCLFEIILVHLFLMFKIFLLLYNISYEIFLLTIIGYFVFLFVMNYQVFKVLFYSPINT